MTWARNCLFLGLVGGGLAALAWTLWPPTTTKPVTSYDARAVVGTEQGPFLFFRRRRFVTWLGDQLSAHRPYDAIVRDLIAGNGLWTDNPNTNFISVTAQQQKKNEPDPVRLAGRVTRAFL